MRFSPIRCPECGQTARGTVEVLAGCAEFEVRGDGEAVYSGYTEVWWDEQRSERNEAGRVHLVCPSGHDWWAEKAKDPVASEAVLRAEDGR